MLHRAGFFVSKGLQCHFSSQAMSTAANMLMVALHIITGSKALPMPDTSYPSVLKNSVQIIDMLRPAVRRVVGSLYTCGTNLMLLSNEPRCPMASMGCMLRAALKTPQARLSDFLTTSLLIVNVRVIKSE
jgi:hypothetical protein